jgi:hypothetical protein
MQENNVKPPRAMTKEEVIAVIKEWAERLGHVPSMAELLKQQKISMRIVRKYFGTYAGALRECGFEKRGSGYQASLDELWVEWAGMVRKLGKIPTVFDWEKHARWSTRPLTSRFRTWGHVPHSLLQYARQNGMEGEWKDVMDIAAANVERRRGLPPTFGTPSGTPPRSRVLQDQPMYGMPLRHPVMLFAPTNEAGVMVLFAAMARDLGYAITRVQTECPDCEAVRTVDHEHCQRVRIEFEKESRNFVAHGHSVNDADMIVCWKHNWPECPLEVLELSRLVTPELP